MRDKANFLPSPFSHALLHILEQKRKSATCIPQLSITVYFDADPDANLKDFQQKKRHSLILLIKTTAAIISLISALKLFSCLGI